MRVAAFEPCLARQISKLDTAFRRITMIAAADDDDAALRGRPHAIEQPVSQNEVAEMVDDELLLEAVHLLPLAEHDAGVQNEHVERKAHRLDVFCTGND